MTPRSNSGETQILIERLDGRRADRLVAGAESVAAVLTYLFERVGWQSAALRPSTTLSGRIARIQFDAARRCPQLVLDFEETRSVSEPSIHVHLLAAAAVAFLN